MEENGRKSLPALSSSNKGLVSRIYKKLTKLKEKMSK
jgi:hypothetical protein